MKYRKVCILSNIYDMFNNIYYSNMQSWELIILNIYKSFSKAIKLFCYITKDKQIWQAVLLFIL